MPQIFRIGSYIVYFWSNENDPLEPVHIHVAMVKPTKNATKIWITRSGNCLLCNNNSNIPKHTLNYIMDIIRARSKEICDMWCNYFGDIQYFC